MMDIKALEEFLQRLGPPDARGMRFQMLCAYAVRCAQAEPASDTALSGFVKAIQERIADWPAEGRKAKDDWWMDLRWEDSVYEYGVNNGGGAPGFYGFLAEPHGLMPLARSATIDNPTVHFRGEHLLGFLGSPAIAGLEILRINTVVGPDLIMGMVESGRFGHLRVLETPYMQGLDKAQMKAFARWKQGNGIFSSKY